MRVSWDEKVQSVSFFVVLTAAFLVFCGKYFGFNIDDSFIAYRYAEHLANHGTLAWNVGSDPVEGFTSFLWMIVNAGAVFLGLSPVLFSKGLSILSALCMIAFLLWKGTTMPWPLQVGLPAALALSPAFAVITIQGLETTFTALLLLGGSVASVRFLQQQTWRWYVLWYGLAFVAGLARPDTLVFNAGIFVAAAVTLYQDGQTTLRSFLLAGAPFLLLGIGYMAWRIWYFGYLLPNPAYIKGGVLGAGIDEVIFFGLHVLAPYLILGGVLLRGADEEETFAVTPLLSGLVLFALYLANIQHIQGYLWRYAFPVFPAFLYVCAYLSEKVQFSNRMGRRIAVALGVILLLWPLHTYPTATSEVEKRTAADRIAVGKALQGIDGKLFTSESGALPYYSEWKTLDLLGLNSEEIAHGTSRLKMLRQFHPDLIGLLVKTVPFSVTNHRWKKTGSYVKEKGYVAVAAIHKSGSRNHLYFVNPTSSVCEETVRRLKNVESVTYTPLQRLAPDSLDVPVMDVSNGAPVQTVCSDTIDSSPGRSKVASSSFDESSGKGVQEKDPCRNGTLANGCDRRQSNGDARSELGTAARNRKSISRGR